MGLKEVISLDSNVDTNAFKENNCLKRPGFCKHYHEIFFKKNNLKLFLYYCNVYLVRSSKQNTKNRELKSKIAGSLRITLIFPFNTIYFITV